MSTTAPIEVLVAGAPGIAAALSESGRFSRIIAVGTTSELRDQIALLGGVDPSKFLFLFADTVVSDVPGAELGTIVSRLSAAGWKVSLFELSAAAREIVATNPAAGLLTAPYTANNVIGAIAGMLGAVVEPVPDAWAFAPLDVHSPDAPAQARLNSTATPAAPQPVGQGYGVVPSSGWPGATPPALAGSPWASAPPLGTSGPAPGTSGPALGTSGPPEAPPAPEWSAATPPAPAAQQAAPPADLNWPAPQAAAPAPSAAPAANSWPSPSPATVDASWPAPGDTTPASPPPATWSAPTAQPVEAPSTPPPDPSWPDPSWPTAGATAGPAPVENWPAPGGPPAPASATVSPTPEWPAPPGPPPGVPQAWDAPSAGQAGESPYAPNLVTPAAEAWAPGPPPQTAAAPAGYAVPGYETPGYETPGYETPGYETPGYAPPGYAPPAYNEPTYQASPGYPPPGYEAPAPAGFYNPAPEQAPAWDGSYPQQVDNGYGTPAVGTQAYPAPLAGSGGYAAVSPGGVDRRGMVIPVCVAKGGAGKSTLTLNTAVFLALKLRELGRTVCVVDANFQQADIGNLIHTYSPTIVDLARRPADLNPDSIRRHMVHVDALQTSFLLGPALTEEANPQWITPELYRSAVDALRHLYDYVFIDTPVAEFHHDLFSDFVLPSADFVIVPVTPDYRAIANTDRWLRSITQPVHAGGLGINPSILGIVLNMATDDVGCDEDQVRVELSSWNYLGAIPESREWKRAANEDDIIATRNVPDVNEALARILYMVTGEEPLRQVETSGSKKGGIGKLLGKIAARG